MNDLDVSIDTNNFSQLKSQKNFIIIIKNYLDTFLNFNSYLKSTSLATSFDIWAIGFSVVIGGQFYGWNAGLITGFGTFGIAQLLMGTAYICLMLCLAEIASTIPFSGGSYGLG